MKLAALFALLAIYSTVPALAVKKENPAGSPPLVARGGGKTMWREWYAFSRQNRPAGYYVEEVVKSGAKAEVSFTQLITETAGLGAQSTFVNSVANDDDRLSPVSFYVKKRTRETIDIFEGVVGGSEMGVRVHVGAENAVPLASIWKITPASILGAFVPYYLAKQAALGKLKKGKPVAFEALLEEGDENRKFSPTKMKAEATEQAIELQGVKCWEFKLDFDGIPAQWWVAENGKLCRMIIPSLGAELTLTTEAKAKSFL